MNWDEIEADALRRMREEEAFLRKEPVTKGGSHVKPGPVRRWEDMTQAERQDVLARIRRIGDAG
jgi:diadenosine tetraphosphate (Ap4A) HIT family hydrolase